MGTDDEEDETDVPPPAKKVRREERREDRRENHLHGRKESMGSAIYAGSDAGTSCDDESILSALNKVLVFPKNRNNDMVVDKNSGSFNASTKNNGGQIAPSSPDESGSDGGRSLQRHLQPKAASVAASGGVVNNAGSVMSGGSAGKQNTAAGKQNTSAGKQNTSANTTAGKQNTSANALFGRTKSTFVPPSSKMVRKSVESQLSGGSAMTDSNATNGNSGKQKSKDIKAANVENKSTSKKDVDDKSSKSDKQSKSGGRRNKSDDSNEAALKDMLGI